MKHVLWVTQDVEFNDIHFAGLTREKSKSVQTKSNFKFDFKTYPQVSIFQNAWGDEPKKWSVILLDTMAY